MIYFAICTSDKKHLISSTHPEISALQLMFGRFGQVVEKKKSISLQDISAVRHFLSVWSPCVYPAHGYNDTVHLFRKSVGSSPVCWAVRSISSMLCVPVVSRATGQVVALACAFNKQGGQRYGFIQHKVGYLYSSHLRVCRLACTGKQKIIDSHSKPDGRVRKLHWSCWQENKMAALAVIRYG